VTGADPTTVAAVCAWYLAHRRELPWRAEGRTPWGVLVSEVMLQQTQVARVLPAWTAWLQRWPTPAALAADAPGEAVRQWGRLGYPRRALRLHAAATAIVERHDGEVPDDGRALRALPGVGEYTAAAVQAFAFGRRARALDTNVRRVLARLVGGVAQPPPALTAAERARAEALLPTDEAAAALWSIAVMELGALVCTARAPACERCPVADACAWVRAGRPPASGPARPAQRFAGTDRQVRGLLLAVLRDAAEPVPPDALVATWADGIQRERALDGLVADGLVEPLPDGRFRLPVAAPAR
jgi:A/G-specific adenine glycosylase